MEGPINLSSSLKSLSLQNLNLTDEVTRISPDSLYPPVIIPLSAPRLKQAPKPPRFYPKSAPILSEGGSLGDIFFSRYEEDQDDWKISYHQRKHSSYPNPRATWGRRSVGNSHCRSGSSVKALSGSSMKEQTNPWNNTKRRKELLVSGNKPGYSNLASSPLVPKVIPVAERVEMIIQEFAPFLSKSEIISQLYEIKSKIKKLMIKGITLRAINKLSQTRADGRQLLWEALTTVTKDLFEKGTILQSYDEEGIDTFIGNMAFIGNVGKLNIVDEMSTLAALIHLCRQHQCEQHPALIIGAEAIVLKSDIDLSATPTGRVIFEYLCRTNPNRIYMASDCLSEQHSEVYVKADYNTPDKSFHIDCYEPLPDYEFYDLYDSMSMNGNPEYTKVP